MLSLYSDLIVVVWWEAEKCSDGQIGGLRDEGEAPICCQVVGTNKKEEITFSLFNSTSKNFIDIDNLSIFWMVTENAIIGRENQLKPNVQCNDHPSVFFHLWFMYSGNESR